MLLVALARRGGRLQFPEERSNVPVRQASDHRDRFSIESHKLNFVAFSVLMDEYDGAYITLLQALFRQVSSKNNWIQLLNHRLLYQVVNRGSLAPSLTKSLP